MRKTRLLPYHRIYYTKLKRRVFFLVYKAEEQYIRIFFKWHLDIKNNYVRTGNKPILKAVLKSFV